MAKFMCIHTVPPGSLTPERVRQFAKAAQEDPMVKGYCSFVNATQGKAICVFEAPSKKEVAAWFNKMGMAFDSITKVELEGDGGNIQEV
jgi:hypothetical protein